MVCWCFSDLWAWFLWTLGSRQIIWMILLRVFFNFVIEVLEGFEAWFLQSFCTSGSSGSSKCLRKASIYRSLGVGEQHVAKSYWCHMSQPDWFTYVIAYMCWIAYVIAYTREDCLCHHLHVRGCLCHLLHVHWCVIGFCMTLGKFPLAFE